MAVTATEYKINMTFRSVAVKLKLTNMNMDVNHICKRSLFFYLLEGTDKRKHIPQENMQGI